MIRDVIVNGRSAKLVIDGGRLRYQREDAGVFETAFSMVETFRGNFSVLFGSRSYTVTSGPHGEFLVNGHAVQVATFDPRDERTRNRESDTRGRQHVTALMPGKVIRVLVAPGDRVEEKQGLVVVEAMKMQNEMKSPKSGRVAEVRAHAGVTVAAGEVLVIVE